MAKSKTTPIPYLVSLAFAEAAILILIWVVLWGLEVQEHGNWSKSFTGPGTMTTQLKGGWDYHISVFNQSPRSYGEIIFDAKVTHVQTGRVVPTHVFGHESLFGGGSNEGTSSLGLLMNIKESGDYRISLSYPPGQTGPRRGVRFGSYITASEIFTFLLKAGSAIVILALVAMVIAVTTVYEQLKAHSALRH